MTDEDDLRLKTPADPGGFVKHEVLQPLAAIAWRGFDPKEIAERIPENAQAAESQLQRISLAEDGDELFVGETVAASAEILAFGPAHVVRIISDIVPNPFVGREIVGATVAALRARGFDDTKLGLLASLIAEELRKGLDAYDYLYDECSRALGCAKQWLCSVPVMQDLVSSDR